MQNSPPILKDTLQDIGNANSFTVEQVSWPVIDSEYASHAVTTGMKDTDSSKSPMLWVLHLSNIIEVINTKSFVVIKPILTCFEHKLERYSFFYLGQELW